ICEVTRHDITESYAYFFMNANEAGEKIITIDPVYTTTASKSNQWISIKPVSDVALLLGMITTIIDNDWYQEDYLVDNTTSPFLVRKDNGKMLRLHDNDEEDVKK